MGKPKPTKILAAGVGLVAAAFVVRGAIQRAGRARAHLAEGIDEKTWVGLGGLDQWVTIRGRRLDNPLLLVLHGGPGAALSLTAPKSCAGWDDAFTVVHWDQRGAGRTFSRHGKRGSDGLSITQMVADGIALAQWLKQRFPGRPIVLLGMSWGSVLGIEMIRARPDLFAAYAGVGQVIDMARGESLSYFGAIDRLRARGDERRAQALEAIGPPPYGLKAAHKQRKLLVSTTPAERRIYRRFPLRVLLAPDGRLSDLAALIAGMRFSGRALWRELMDWKLSDGGLEFAVPLVFLQGEFDLQTPTALVTETLPRLRAPSKDLVILEGAAHLGFITHADRFRRDLVDRVRPLAVGKKKRGRTPA